jgi:integrase
MAFREEAAVATVMKMTDERGARRTLAEAAISAGTRRQYESALVRMDAVARAAGIAEGMVEKGTFLRLLAALHTLGRSGTSSGTSLRAALAWRQLRDGHRIWANDEDVKEAALAFQYASRATTSARGALTEAMLATLVRHLAYDAGLMLMVQWHCGLRPAEVISLPQDCLAGNHLLLYKDKRHRRGAKVHQQLHWKPISARARLIVEHAVALAQAAQRRTLFTLSAPAYRKGFRRGVVASGIQEADLNFVPHSARHGFTHETAANLVPPEVQARLGMSAPVAPRYMASNALRVRAVKGSKVD